jgi:hypothetical protein
VRGAFSPTVLDTSEVLLTVHHWPEVNDFDPTIRRLPIGVNLESNYKVLRDTYSHEAVTLRFWGWTVGRVVGAVFLLLNAVALSLI